MSYHFPSWSVSQAVSYFAGNQQTNRLLIVPIPLPRTVQVRGLGIWAFHVKHDFVNLDLQRKRTEAIGKLV